jgi:hypothetical protein
MSDWQAFHADQLAIQQHLEQILLEAGYRPLTKEEVTELKAACGIVRKREREDGTYCF